MVLRCLRAELMKCRRAPVWLAFLVLPLFPAVLGTFNYLGNLEVLGRRLVQPVDPAHPVCLHVLPPRPVRRVLRLAVAAGARRPQLERRPHRPGTSACALPGQAAAGRGGVRPGHGPHRPALSPQRQAGRYLRPLPPELPAGWPSAPWAVRRCAPYSSTSVWPSAPSPRR